MISNLKKTSILLLLILVLVTGCSTNTPTTDSKEETTKAVDFSESTEKTTVEEPEATTSPTSAAPSSASINAAEIRIGALKGPTAMGMVQLMSESEQSGSGAANYQFNIAAAIDEVGPKLIQGDLDIAAVPANMASVLFNNSKGQIQVLAINTLGVLYIVENGNHVQSIEDLRGKTIFAYGKGATPELALNYILSSGGLSPDNDVNIEWKSEHTECVVALAQSENAVAMLPQPFVSTAQLQNDQIRIALDMTEEWENLQDGSITPSAMITGVTVVRKAFAEENSTAVSNFLDMYKASADYANQNIDGTAALIGKYEIIPEAVAKKALPYCSIAFIEGEEMKEKLSGYLQVLLDQNPESIGGELPSDDFYFIR